MAVLWLALIFWTYTDARRRIADPLLVSLRDGRVARSPSSGTIVYLIVRPPEFLDDVHERELEMAAAEARLSQLERAGLPVLRLRGREELPALPELPAAAQGAVRDLRQAARPALEDLPVLRGRGRPGAARRGGARRAPGRASRGGRRAAGAPGSRPRTREPTAARCGAGTGPERGARPAPRAARRPADGGRRTERPRSAPAPRARRTALTARVTGARSGPHPDPREARRLRPRPDRRGHRPLRAQGPRDRRR